VFVALWPTPAVRTRLSEVADQLARLAVGGRQMAAANLHLTLAFIGMLQADRVADLARGLADCATSEFDWVVDRVGHFSAARVVWAGGADSANLRAVTASVRELLESMDIDFDRKPFAAHVTLLRDVARWNTPHHAIDPSIVWRCQRPALIRSDPGPHGVSYTPVQAG
jgi:RNA 2',3'-cyclic 3'-phosphodiesterase